MAGNSFSWIIFPFSLSLAVVLLGVTKMVTTAPLTPTLIEPAENSVTNKPNDEVYLRAEPDVEFNAENLRENRDADLIDEGHTAFINKVIEGMEKLHFKMGSMLTKMERRIDEKGSSLLEEIQKALNEKLNIEVNPIPLDERALTAIEQLNEIVRDLPDKLSRKRDTDYDLGSKSTENFWNSGEDLFGNLENSMGAKAEDDFDSYNKDELMSQEDNLYSVEPNTVAVGNGDFGMRGDPGRLDIFNFQNSQGLPQTLFPGQFDVIEIKQIVSKDDDNEEEPMMVSLPGEPHEISIPIVGDLDVQEIEHSTKDSDSIPLEKEGEVQVSKVDLAPEPAITVSETPIPSTGDLESPNPTPVAIPQEETLTPSPLIMFL